MRHGLAEAGVRPPIIYVILVIKVKILFFEHRVSGIIKSAPTSANQGVEILRGDVVRFEHGQCFGDRECTQNDETGGPCFPLPDGLQNVLDGLHRYLGSFLGGCIVIVECKCHEFPPLLDYKLGYLDRHKRFEAIVSWKIRLDSLLPRVVFVLGIYRWLCLRALENVIRIFERGGGCLKLLFTHRAPRIGENVFIHREPYEQIVILTKRAGLRIEFVGFVGCFGFDFPPRMPHSTKSYASEVTTAMLGPRE